MLEQKLVILLLKVAVAASLASIMARFNSFKSMLMRENRNASERLQFAFGISVIYGASVLTRVVLKGYDAVDLGLEGSLIAGIVGGYISGLVSGILISLPAMFHGEWLAMPLMAGAGVLGGLIHDCAPEEEEIWQLSPFFDLSLYRLIFQRQDVWRAAFHLFFLLAILFVEAIRSNLGQVFGQVKIFALQVELKDSDLLTRISLYLSTLLAVTLPIKIWNNTRNESKLEMQQRLLTEARLVALTNQINPHFLFNTLNSVSTLIRINPDQARSVVYKLSNILRRLLRKHDNLTPLRDELAFIDDYMAIEMVRFGDKLRFVKEVDSQSLDFLVPSMLLQPLVENSIRHGLSSKVDGGMIRVRSRLQDGRLVLLVEDDGVGIPESRLANLFGQGIGVSNVNERLRVLFGTNYRMWIDSKPGEGTRTEIEIPPTSVPLAAVS